MGMDTQAVGCEVFLENLPDRSRKTDAISPLEIPALLPITRDFAFIVDRTVNADTLLAALRNADKQYIQAASVFDVYQGPHVAAHQQSLAVTVTLQPGATSFTDADIAAISQRIVSAVTAKTGAVLRS